MDASIVDGIELHTTVQQWGTSLKFLIIVFIFIDDVKCFISPNKFLECCKDNEEFCNLLEH